MKDIEEKARLEPLLGDETGATMVEYGLMLALIAIVCIVAVTAIGVNVSTLFQTSANAL